MSVRYIRHLALVAILGLTLGLAACGGGSSSGGTSSGGTGAGITGSGK